MRRESHQYRRLVPYNLTPRLKVVSTSYLGRLMPCMADLGYDVLSEHVGHPRLLDARHATEAEIHTTAFPGGDVSADRFGETAE